jgi:hypothetical protein
MATTTCHLALESGSPAVGSSTVSRASTGVGEGRSPGVREACWPSDAGRRGSGLCGPRRPRRRRPTPTTWSARTKSSTGAALLHELDAGTESH